MKIIFIFIIIVIIIGFFLYNQTFSDIDLNNIHVYLISLPKNADRRENFEKFYKGKYQYFEAVNGSELNGTNVNNIWNCLPPDANYGTKGLQLSNIKIFEDAIKNNYEWILIFEDDAEPPKDFNNKLIKTMKKYSDSRVIYLDARNQGGDGVTPECCLACVLYHKSVFILLVQELNPEKSIYMQDYKIKDKKIKNDNVCLYDWYLSNLLSHYKIKTSSEPIVISNNLGSTIDSPEEHMKKKKFFT
jgi:hypothetical protein